MNIRYKTLRRVVITAPIEEKDDVFLFLQRNGYRISRSGPLPVGGYRVDPKRIKIVAEKAIK